MSLISLPLLEKAVLGWGRPGLFGFLLLTAGLVVFTCSDNNLAQRPRPADVNMCWGLCAMTARLVFALQAWGKHSADFCKWVVSAGIGCLKNLNRGADKRVKSLFSVLFHFAAAQDPEVNVCYVCMNMTQGVFLGKKKRKKKKRAEILSWTNTQTEAGRDSGENKTSINA